MTSSQPTPGAAPKLSPVTKDSDNTALCDALSVEHSTIYGYGIVSALSPPGVNNLVVEALQQHRQRRDDVIAMLTARKVTAPVAAAGYQLPLLVGSAALTQSTVMAARWNRVLNAWPITTSFPGGNE
jgi:hypothetical protein